MILALRILALLGLGLVALGAIEVLLIYGIPLTVGTGFSLLMALVLLGTSYLAQLLCLALCILALLSTARSRQWGWFTLLAFLAVISVALPTILYFLLSTSPTLPSLESVVGLEVATLVELFLLPALLPVGTVAYTLRSI